MPSLRTALAVILFISSSAFAGPKLVKISDSFISPPASSNPNDFHRAGSIVFFRANDGLHGWELWKTDGTTAGTSRVTDISPGVGDSVSDIVGTMGSAVVFTTFDKRLWRSDGSDQGTFALGILPAPVGYGGPLIVTAGTRTFALDGETLYVADDGPGTLRKVKSLTIDGGVKPLGLNGKVYFSGPGRQAWASDGSSNGTVPVAARCPDCEIEPTGFFALRGVVHFTSRSGIFRIDSSGPVLAVSIEDGVIFSSSESVAYILSGGKVRRTDGTPAGTTEGGTLPLSFRSYVRVLPDGRLALVRRNVETIEMDLSQVWSSDGTEAGTALVTEVPYHADHQVLASIGTTIFLSGGTQASGAELWRADLTSGTASFVFDIDDRTLPGASPYGLSSSPGEGNVLGDAVIFPATSALGRELWITDGTAAGTRLLKSIASDPTGGIVSGTVRDSSTGQPIAGVQVALCSSRCEDWVLTDAQGIYRFIGILPGSYRVEASGPLHLKQIYSGIDCPCPAGATGTPVSVASGYETAGVDFSLIRGGTIRGTARLVSTSAPAPMIDILLYNNTIKLSFQTSTDGSGAYVSPALPAGDYYVRATQKPGYSLPPVVNQLFRGADCYPGGCPNESGELVHLSPVTDVTGVDFALSTYGRITGRLLDASGVGVRRVSVHFWREVLAGSLTRDSAVVSGEDGTYASAWLPPGRYYVKTGDDEGYSGTYYPNVACPNYSCTLTGASAVTVEPGSTTSGIDITLTTRKARITGVVRDRSGYAGTFAVYLLNSYGETYASALTAAGRYDFFDLPDGMYYVLAERTLHAGGLCEAPPCNTAAGTPIALTAGVTTIVDVRLREEFTTISGKLLDAKSGLPVWGQVTLVPLESREKGAYSYTDSDGSYKVQVVSAATSFHVRALPSASTHQAAAHPDIVWQCAGDMCEAPAGAVSVPAGIRTGIDIAVQPLGTVKGRILDSRTGKPSSARVDFYPESGAAPIAFSPGPDGTYSGRLPNGSYRVVARGPGFFDQLYRMRDCPVSCDVSAGEVVTIADGATASAIDFALTAKVPSASITGRVLAEATGLPIARAVVQARGNTISHTFTVLTDANGDYVITGTASSPMAAGNYELTVSAFDGYFFSRYNQGDCIYGSCPSYAGVYVNSGATLSNVDFILRRLEVNSMLPATGPASGGTTITIDGANFGGDSTVKIGGVIAPIISCAHSRIIVTAPPGVAGTATVTINRGVYALVLQHAFIYTAPPQTLADFNADGKADLVLRENNGGVGMWQMDGPAIVSGAYVGSPGGTYTIAGTGDFNGDRRTDILLRDQLGNLGMWLMDGASITYGALVGSPGQYTVAAVADFSGDGRSDVLLRDHLGNLGMWIMNGPVITGGYLVGSPGGYTVAAAADFDGDGKADVLLRDSGGNLGMWLMNGAAIVAGGSVGATGSYSVAAASDFTGDGKADILLRDSFGELGMWIMSGSSLISGAYVGSPGGYDVAKAADFDGDGKSDIVLRHEGSGNLGMWLMNGPFIRTGALVGSTGAGYSIH